LDRDDDVVHIVRGLECYVWEGFDRGGNVIESREVRKWRRELVGSLRLSDFGDMAALQEELTLRILQAVVGTSRLPLTSVEAPLPAFSFGLVSYLGAHSATEHDTGEVVRSLLELLQCGLQPDLSPLQVIKGFEAWLRAVPLDTLASAAEEFMVFWKRSDRHPLELPALLRGLFREVSLSPYTDFVDKVLAVLELFEQGTLLSPGEAADFLTYLLRLAGRHLTAYDLVTFHNQGANYPDALLVDAILRHLIEHVSRYPDLYFAIRDGEERARRLRRRGFRQGCLFRRHYEGLPVPDSPTSQGEHVRVLPGSNRRVPAEQISKPLSRRRRLFEGARLDDLMNPASRDLLGQALEDLSHAEELRELGMALILDRPLGVHKHPLEPDSTPMLSNEAFSRTIAHRRLDELTEQLGWVDSAARHDLGERLDSLAVTGVPLASIPALNRPVPVSLDDARKVADDFVLLRTTQSSAESFLRLFTLPKHDFLDRPLLIVRDGAGLAIYDECGRKRMVLSIRADEGYRCRGGVEFPAGGLEVRGQGSA
jgi:hypothetical protein